MGDAHRGYSNRRLIVDKIVISIRYDSIMANGLYQDYNSYKPYRFFVFLSNLIPVCVVLGSGCKGAITAKIEEKSKMNGVHNPPVHNQHNGLSSNNHITLDACQTIQDKLKQLVNDAGLDHLQNAPVVMGPSDFYGIGVKKAVEDLFSSFATPSAYPEALKEPLMALSAFTFRSGWLGRLSGQYKHKIGYGTAINAIAIYYKELSDVYTHMMQMVDGGVPFDGMGALEKKLDACFQQVHALEITLFKDDTKFYALCNFENLMRRNIGPVWIKLTNAVAPIYWLADKHTKIFKMHPFPNSGEDIGAIKQESLAFDQLFFALFRESLKVSLLDLKETSIGGNVSIYALDINHKTFKKLKEVVGRGADAFAQYLGNHIESNSGLDRFFVVPNVDDFREIDHLPCARKEASKSPGLLRYNDLTGRLYKAILHVYDPKQDTNSVFELIRSMEKLSERDVHVTFVQLLCADLAKSILWGGSLYRPSTSTKSGSGSKLLMAVSNIIKEETDCAIVKKAGGKYLPTPITKQILKGIQECIAHLSKAGDGMSITYATIKDNTGTKFDINQVRLAMQKDCIALKSLLGSVNRLRHAL